MNKTNYKLKPEHLCVSCKEYGINFECDCLNKSVYTNTIYQNDTDIITKKDSSLYFCDEDNYQDKKCDILNYGVRKLPVGINRISCRFNKVSAFINSSTFLTCLEIFCCSDDNITNIIWPVNLKKLVVTGSPFAPINFPSSLEILKINDYDYPLNNLPANLNSLIIFSQFDNHFNHPLENLPANLKKLEFIKNESGYDYPIDNLPEGLEILDIRVDFSNKFILNLPKSLLKLYLGGNDNIIINELPPNIKVLTFAMNFEYHSLLEKLPEGLKILNFYDNDNYVDEIPDNLLDYLPESLRYLFFHHGSDFDYPIDNLPKSLYCLRLGYTFNQSVDNLPESLTYLTFGDGFNQPVDNLPNSLKYINLGRSFNKPIYNLPNSIQSISVGSCFEQSIDNLPTNAKFSKKAPSCDFKSCGYSCSCFWEHRFHFSLDNKIKMDPDNMNEDDKKFEDKDDVVDVENASKKARLV